MKSTAAKGCQLEKGGHKPGCAALCRSEERHNVDLFIGKAKCDPV